MKQFFPVTSLLVAVVTCCSTVFAGEDAMQCLSILRMGSNTLAESGRAFKNNCNYAIEVAWCFESRDCKHGNWGFGNTWSIGPGRTYPATTFSANVSSAGLYYAACKGANSTIKEEGRGRYICK